jgi:hypothetical protein
MPISHSTAAERKPSLHDKPAWLGRKPTLHEMPTWFGATGEK